MTETPHWKTDEAEKAELKRRVIRDIPVLGFLMALKKNHVPLPRCERWRREDPEFNRQVKETM